MHLVFRLFLFLFFCTCKRKETKEKHGRFSCLRAFGRQGCGEIFLLSVPRPKSPIGASLRLNGFRSKLVQGGLKSFYRRICADRGNQTDLLKKFFGGRFS